MTSESVSRAGRPVFGGSEEHSSFHQSSTRTYNETKKESRSIATPPFGESLVQHKVWAPSPLARITHHSSQCSFTEVLRTSRTSLQRCTQRRGKGRRIEQVLAPPPLKRPYQRWQVVGEQQECRRAFGTWPTAIL